jgi:hypothetical protein
MLVIREARFGVLVWVRGKVRRVDSLFKPPDPPGGRERHMFSRYRGLHPRIRAVDGPGYACLSGCKTLVVNALCQLFPGGEVLGRRPNEDPGHRGGGEAQKPIRERRVRCGSPHHLCWWP